MEQNRRNSVTEILLLIASGFLLSQFSIGMFIFTVPFLLAAPGFKNKNVPVLMIALSGLFSVIMELVNFKGFIGDSAYYGIIGFSLYYPLAITLVSAMWIRLRDFSSLVLRKLVISNIPVVILGLGLALWLSSGNGKEAFSLFTESVTSIIPSQLTEQIDAQLFAEVFMSLMLICMVPFGMIFGSLPVLISEFIIHKTDETWQNDFADMLMPPFFAWICMGLWAIAISGSLFLDLPLWLSVVVWNLVLGLSLHYILAGISIICARTRRKNPEIKSSKICVFCLICCFMPGMNIVFVSGFFIAGILETWIKMR